MSASCLDDWRPAPVGESQGCELPDLFGDVSTSSLGTIRIRVPVSPTWYADLCFDVVDLDVPFLFRIDMLDR